MFTINIFGKKTTLLFIRDRIVLRKPPETIINAFPWPTNTSLGDFWPSVQGAWYSNFVVHETAATCNNLSPRERKWEELNKQQRSAGKTLSLTRRLDNVEIVLFFFFFFHSVVLSGAINVVCDTWQLDIQALCCLKCMAYFIEWQLAAAKDGSLALSLFLFLSPPFFFSYLTVYTNILQYSFPSCNARISSIRHNYFEKKKLRKNTTKYLSKQFNGSRAPIALIIVISIIIIIRIIIITNRH